MCVSGFELVTDLFLADCLVRQGWASKVVLHTKGHPTFVSDAMDKVGPPRQTDRQEKRTRRDAQLPFV